MMNTVMQKPSSVGENRTCPDCENVEVVGKEQTSTWQGKTTTKIRWANQMDRGISQRLVVSSNTNHI